MSARKQVSKKVTKKASRNNPTLHGLLVARTLSGTVVRTLLFVVLAAALIIVATVNIDDGQLGALSLLAVMSAIYLLFDVLYVLMANIRPWHPRLDRVVLPVALVISLVTVYAPLVFVTSATVNVFEVWLTGVIVLVFILGVRVALMIASSNQ